MKGIQGVLELRFENEQALPREALGEEKHYSSQNSISKSPGARAAFLSSERINPHRKCFE